MKPTLLRCLPFVALAAPLAAQHTMLVSRTPDGVAAGDGHQVRISGNGRFVAFGTKAAVVPRDTNLVSDIYLYDRQTETYELVSVSSEGEISDDGGSSSWISADGRYVVFQSSSTNLVPDDTNEVSDIFLRDRELGTTTRVSIGYNGVEPDKKSYFPRISGDGSTVVFTSEADLVWTTPNKIDTFAYDVATGETTQVSVSSTGAVANDLSISTSVSHDGRFVCYSSDATNLVPQDLNGWRDIFVHDRETGTTVRVSESASGEEGLGISMMAAISPDGNAVAFGSQALNLVPGLDTPHMVLYVKELDTGAIERVHAVPTDLPPGVTNGSLSYPRLSGDGRYVAWSGSTEDGLTAGAFRADRLSGEKTRVDVDCQGNASTNWGTGVMISDDGVFVAFSASGDLWPENSHLSDVYLHGPGLPCASLRGQGKFISVSLGGRQELVLDAGKAHAGEPYLLLGSSAGSDPGLALGEHVLPLALDGASGYFVYTATHANEPPLEDSFGVLDFLGEAQTSFGTVGGLPSGLVGTELRHAFVVLDSEASTIASVSTPLALTFVP